MFVVTLDYWPAGDVVRSDHQGWAAVIREHRSGRPEWVVTSMLDGRRYLWTQAGTNTALGAIVAALNAVGAIDTYLTVESSPDAVDERDGDGLRLRRPPARSGRLHHNPEGELRTLMSRMTEAVETHLRGHMLPLGQPMAAAPVVDRRVPQRLGARLAVLALPMLTEHQVQDLFPGQRDHPAIVRGLRKAGALIGLRHKGERLYPAFQFAGARPHPVATAVNLELRCDLDPWKSAIWWNTKQNLLGVRPVELVDDLGELDRLMNAARAFGQSSRPGPTPTSRRDSGEETA